MKRRFLLWRESANLECQDRIHFIIEKVHEAKKQHDHCWFTIRHRIRIISVVWFLLLFLVVQSVVQVLDWIFE